MKNLFPSFSPGLGIDLGTSNVLIYLANKGIVVNEPAIVAFNQKTGEVLAVGREAYQMLGRTPSYLVAAQPINYGVISDFELTGEMLKSFFQRFKNSTNKIFPYRPQAVVTVSCGTTDVERKAVEDVVCEAGASKVYLVEGPLASAIGSRIPIFEPSGNIIVDIGGGASEVAVISLGGIVKSKSLKVGGQKFNEDIIKYIKDKHHLLIGEPTAEEVKIRIGSAIPVANENLEMTIKGRDLASGLPKEIEISNSEISRALEKSLDVLLNSLHGVIEDIPPEIAADIHGKNIWLSGGSALLRGLADLIAESCGVSVCLVDDPLTAAARGTGLIVENLDQYKNILIYEEKGGI